MLVVKGGQNLPPGWNKVNWSAKSAGFRHHYIIIRCRLHIKDNFKPDEVRYLTAPFFLHFYWIEIATIKLLTYEKNLAPKLGIFFDIYIFCTCANSHCQERYCVCVITVQRTLKVALSHRLRPSLGLTTTLSELCRANLPFLYSCTKRFNSMRRKGGKKRARTFSMYVCGPNGNT